MNYITLDEQNSLVNCMRQNFHEFDDLCVMIGYDPE